MMIKWHAVQSYELYCMQCRAEDVLNSNVENIAVYYLKNEISTRYKQHMISLKERIRYNVVDESCPSKLFDAKDISIQQVAMDTKGKEKEWVAVVNLNTKSEDGYLQSELPKCKVKNYLIGTTVKVQAYVDSTNCCDGLRDYEKCKKVIGCDENKLLEMKDFNDKTFSREVKLTGADYTIKDTHHYHRKRRRLFVTTGKENFATGSC